MFNALGGAPFRSVLFVVMVSGEFTFDINNEPIRFSVSAPTVGGDGCDAADKRRGGKGICRKGSGGKGKRAKGEEI